MEKQFGKVRRRFEHFIRTTRPFIIIKLIDLARGITNDQKEKNLLDVPDKVRDHYKEQP